MINNNFDRIQYANWLRTRLGSPKGPQIMDHSYITSAKGLDGSRKWLTFITLFMLTLLGRWVRKSTKMCWRNIWMAPKGPQIITHGMWRRAELFSCGFLLHSWAIFFSFLPHLDTNFRSRSPLGPFSNFHVIALLTFEAKTISLLVWYAQTSTSTSMTFNYCISIRFVFFSFYLSPYLWTIGPNTL